VLKQIANLPRDSLEYKVVVWAVAHDYLTIDQVQNVPVWTRLQRELRRAVQFVQSEAGKLFPDEDRFVRVLFCGTRF